MTDQQPQPQQPRLNAQERIAIRLGQREIDCEILQDQIGGLAAQLAERDATIAMMKEMSAAKPATPPVVPASTEPLKTK